MNKLSSQDRSSLIRLASSLPVGDQNRREILSAIQIRRGSNGAPPKNLRPGDWITVPANTWVTSLDREGRAVKHVRDLENTEDFLFLRFSENPEEFALGLYVVRKPSSPNLYIIEGRPGVVVKS